MYDYLDIHLKFIFMLNLNQDFCTTFYNIKSVLLSQQLQLQSVRVTHLAASKP